MSAASAPPPDRAGFATSPGLADAASTDGSAGSSLVARPVGVARAGRDRRHLSPARSRRVTAAFTEAEYTALVVAARRVGLTATGFCAQAALAVTTTAGSGAATVAGGADPRVEALAQLQAELAALRVAVVRTGTNLNQAVTVLHGQGAAPLWLQHVTGLCGQALRAVDAAAARVHRLLP